MRHYTLEYKTVYPIISGVKHSYEAKFYINYATDTLVPRGNWNPVGFWDLMRRGWGRLAHLAIDVTGSFWIDNVKENVAINEWLFEGVRELILYDGSEHPLFKNSNDLNEFKKSYRDGPRHLSFIPTDDGGKLVNDAGVLLSTYLSSISEGASVEEFVSQQDIVEDFEYPEDDPTDVDADQEESTRSRRERLVASENEEKPHVDVRVRIMELVVSAPMSL